MPLHALSTIPNGSNVFLDANVLIYGLGAGSAECVALLRRCAQEEVVDITSFHIISEVTHRLMIEEAKSKGLAGTQARKTLNDHPDRVRKLIDYWKDIERLLSINLLILTVDEEIIRDAQRERAAYGLLNNDSLTIACMRLCGISMLASRDIGFEHVSNIAVFAPTDV